MSSARRGTGIPAKAAFFAALVAVVSTGVAYHFPALAAWYVSLADPVRAALVTGFCTISSGVIAAGIAFLGVAAANRSSLARLHVQHRQDTEEAERKRLHDSHEKRADRKGAIRREVYLKAIEKAHAAVVAPVRLLDRSIDDRAADDLALQEFLSANAQVRLVCEPSALALSFEVTSLLSEFYVKGVERGIAIRQQMTSVHKIRKDIIHAVAAARELRLMADKVIANGENRPDRPTHIAVAEKLNYVTSLERARDRMLSGLIPMRRQHYKDGDAANLALQLALAKYQSALREELHLEGNAQQAMGAVGEMRSRAHAALGIDSW